jgi:predicted DNA-binding protein
MIRLTPEDYDRLSALAANDGVAMAVKGREVMLVGMDPQIFGERYYDVERLLRSVVKAEMETHSERLHKRLYRVGGITAAMVYFDREILSRILELDPQGVTQMWREAEGHGFKYMGVKHPEPTPDDDGAGSTP